MFHRYGHHANIAKFRENLALDLNCGKFRYERTLT